MIELTCKFCSWRKSLETSEKMSAWTVGLEHAWYNIGHLVRAIFDGKMKYTQTVHPVKKGFPFSPKPTKK